MKTTIALCLCVCGIARGVHVDDLSAQVAGHFGKPLGTRIILEGRQHEGGMIPNPLRVSSIDGRAINEEVVVVEIRGAVKLEKGVTYRLEGYESGEFSGTPSWVAPEAQQPFHFRTFFVVVKVVEPKSK